MPSVHVEIPAVSTFPRFDDSDSCASAARRMVMHTTTMFYSGDHSISYNHIPWPFAALRPRPRLHMWGGSYGRLNLSLSSRAIRSAMGRSIGGLVLSLSRSDSRRSMGGGGGDLGLDLYKSVSIATTPTPLRTPHTTTSHNHITQPHHTTTSHNHITQPHHTRPMHCCTKLT
jgi:hypothetical protein